MKRDRHLLILSCQIERSSVAAERQEDGLGYVTGDLVFVLSGFTFTALTERAELQDTLRISS